MKVKVEIAYGEETKYDVYGDELFLEKKEIQRSYMGWTDEEKKKMMDSNPEIKGFEFDYEE